MSKGIPVAAALALAIFATAIAGPTETAVAAKVRGRFTIQPVFTTSTFNKAPHGPRLKARHVGSSAQPGTWSHYHGFVSRFHTGQQR